MSLADEVAELRRRVADMVRRGVVDEVIPGSPVMVRVDIGDVLSPPLPRIQVQSGRYMQVSNYPAPGDAVTVISEAGDLRNGRVYPGPILTPFLSLRAVNTNMLFCLIPERKSVTTVRLMPCPSRWLKAAAIKLPARESSTVR